MIDIHCLPFEVKDRLQTITSKWIAEARGRGGVLYNLFVESRDARLQVRAQLSNVRFCVWTAWLT